MSSFTPGPWRVAGPHDYIYTEGDPYAHGTMLVAQVRGWGHLTGTGGGCAFSDKKAIAIQHANAHLIAAAPDLLARCQELVAVITATEPTYDTNTTLAAARAAIAKAEGR